MSFISEKIITKNINFKKLIKKRKISTIIYYSFLMLWVSLFFLPSADKDISTYALILLYFFTTIIVFVLFIISFFVYAESNLLYDVDKKLFKKNKNEAIFDYVTKDMSIYFLIENYDGNKKYFKDNGFELEYNSFIENKIFQRKFIYIGKELVDDLELFAKNHSDLDEKEHYSVITKEDLSLEDCYFFKDNLISAIDFWFILEEELSKKIHDIELNSLKYKIFKDNIKFFIELGNFDIENTNRVYKYFKENNIESEYIALLEKHISSENIIIDNKILNSLNIDGNYIKSF